MKKFKVLIATVIIIGIFVSAMPTVFAASEKATVTAGSLNVRKGPSTSYSVIDSIYEGTQVTVAGKSGSWTKISYSGKTGYVSSAYLKFSAKASGSNNTTTTSTLRNGDNGSAVTTLQNNLKKLGFFTSSATGLFGSITEKAVKDFQKSAGITADGIAGPTTQSKINAALNKGTTTTVKGRTDITLRLGASSKDVTDLQNALKNKGYFKVTPTGYFGSTTRSAVIAFQKDNGLTRDGIAGPKTLSKLYGSSTALKPATSTATTNKKTKIELSDWYKVMDKVFARGDVATITDVKTGTSFKIKRHGGTKHADVEPLTASDTAKMKKIYGGKWSWARRAVIVEVDGRRFAASMNGMPHGGSSLPYNNFNGHFCIHTLNSRTHGSNKVDADHQAAAKYALNNGK